MWGEGRTVMVIRGLSLVTQKKQIKDLAVAGGDRR